MRLPTDLTRKVGFVALRQNEPASSGRLKGWERVRLRAPLCAALLVAARQVPPCGHLGGAKLLLCLGNLATQQRALPSENALTGQAHDDFQPRGFTISAGDGAVTGFNAGLDDGKAETDSAGFARAGDTDAVKRRRLLLGLETIKFRQRADEQAVAGDGGCGHAHFVEGVFVQQFVFGAGGEDVGVAIFAQRKNLSVRCPR